MSVLHADIADFRVTDRPAWPLTFCYVAKASIFEIQEEGIGIMSAEQMRVELESFVNKGLSEGLRGWPTKHWPVGGVESGRSISVSGTSDISSWIVFSRKGRMGVTAGRFSPLSG